MRTVRIPEHRYNYLTRVVRKIYWMPLFMKDDEGDMVVTGEERYEVWMN